MVQKGQNQSRLTLLLAGFAVVILGAVLFIAFTFFDLSHKIDLLTYSRISTPQELKAIEADPDGHYILTEDIDMSGQEWIPFTFNGIIEGNGHKISNLSIDQTGTAERSTYDGNMKEYSTCFAGMFDVMENARINDLELSNLNVEIEADTPCFIGSFAGYIGDSCINNCRVDGVLLLRAYDRMFGVGGIAGYGYGRLTETRANVTLICIDTDREHKDEQFMGGACAAGYPDIIGCDIAIDGYDSDHGYVHNGGLIGLLRIFPEGNEHDIEIGGNHVSGKITFFEDNDDRRAYCEAFIGEPMERIAYWWDNTEEFVCDEVFDYDTDLLP